uniref:hypothetical protein n=1 Tax=Ningiella ruwaisensis TaxID=2364274 RepID=UPI00109F157A|nr:hypothetical protein [Ningiella ruwaisensis]
MIAVTYVVTVMALDLELDDDEEIMERPVFTHELANENIVEEIKQLSRGDFMRIVQRSDDA